MFGDSEHCDFSWHFLLDKTWHKYHTYTQQWDNGEIQCAHTNSNFS